MTYRFKKIIKMRKSIITIIVFTLTFILSNKAEAQQDPNFTLYNFNMNHNPIEIFIAISIILICIFIDYIVNHCPKCRILHYFCSVLLILDNTKKIRDAIDKSEDKHDEEHRVWYVGVTRAKQNLYIMTAKQEEKGYDIESLE